MAANPLETLIWAFSELVPKKSDTELVIAFAVALLAAYVINQLVGLVTRRVVRFLNNQTDNASTDERFQRLRRTETFMSIGLGVGRTVVVAAALLLAWRSVFPTLAPVALFSASTILLFFLGATIAPLLRDITYGFVMTAERWFNVGDHVKIEPFADVNGVVEHISLRSIQLRSLTGEVVWVHNQHIQGVHVTPRAVRTLAIDVFVNDLDTGHRIINEALKTLPAGPTMVTREMCITETEQVGELLWRITATGQTAIGREWLIENFAVSAIIKQDEINPGRVAIVHGPLVRYADAVAEKRFRRSNRRTSTGKRTTAPPASGEPKPPKAP